MEAHLRPEQIKSLPQGGEIQDGNTGNHQNIPPTRGMGYLNRLQGGLLPYTNTGTIQEISEISCPRSNLAVQGSAFWSVHSTLGIHCGSKGGKTNGHAKGYKNPPVARQLVGEGQVPPRLSPAYQGPGENVSRPTLASKFREIRTGTKTSLRLCRLPVRPQVRSGPAHNGPMADPQNKDQTLLALPVCLVRQFMSLIGLLTATEKQVHLIRLHMRPIQWHLKNHWRVPESLEKVIPIPKSLHPHLQWWLEESNVLQGQPLHPIKHALQIFTDASREGWGAHLNGHMARGSWSLPESKLHINYLELKAVFLALRVPRPLREQDSSCSNRQHYSSVIYKQGRRHEVGPTLCPAVENLDLVYPETSDSQSPTHPRSAECGSRQAIPARPDHSDRVVSPSRGFSDYMQQVEPASNRPVCHQVHQQVTSVCITSTGPPSNSCRCTQSVMGGSGRICLPTSSHLGQSGGEVTGLPMQENHCDCSGVAQHALVLGSSEHIQPNPTEPAQSSKPVDTALQSDPSQKSDKPKSLCMAPRATAIKEQGFSKAVAARIEAPQRGSTRSVYEAKWTIFTKWCITNQVDFRAPPVKSVADFLMYLFQDRKLQPSTIDGYRSAIADKLGNSSINVSKDENLTRLLDSFHRDRPKGRRGIPSWNLSLVLHQLTKAPFEPIREASLKHLTFKTVFLLALGSGKRRSEIHAWQNKNIRHQSDWSKVSLYPSPSFLSKNQLAKEGPDSVAPVVIPALAPTLDRSLCPVRALRYYLDRTSGRIRS